VYRPNTFMRVTTSGSSGTERTCVMSGMLSASCDVMFARWISRIFSPSFARFGYSSSRYFSAASLRSARPSTIARASIWPVSVFETEPIS